MFRNSVLYCIMKQLFYLPLLLVSLSVGAQSNKYPQDYFRNPLDIPIFLAGNFGECRPGHFHSGIDIKTLGKENEPVHAAADGYVSRIKIDKNGFGHGIYITHPNGYTTLYAHLNDFAPAIQKYVHEVQYERKRWDVDLQILPSQFPVKKGDLIAYSGNTGGSTAPHLHFEIRSGQTDHPLNPELFGLPIIDKIPPVPVEVVIYFGPRVYYSAKLTLPLKKTGDSYKPVKSDQSQFPVNGDTVKVPAWPIAIGVNADDFMDGSESTLAYYQAKLFMDGKIQEEITLDNIGYDETRYLNAFADYKTHQLTKKWVQCLFQVPGNRLNNLYSNQNSEHGILDMTDSKVHKIDIVLADDMGNESKILFYVDPIAMGDTTGLACTEFKVGKPALFKNDKVSFSLDERQIYEDFCFHYNAIAANDLWSDKFSLGYSYIPVHHNFELQIKPNKPVPEALKNKVVLMYNDDKETDGRAASASDNGWYHANVRNFGTYWLDIDTEPPVIEPQQKNNANLSKATQITFKVKDAMTSVRSFSGLLDGKWICFEAHADLIFYKFDDHCEKGRHKLVFKSEDENGNSSTYKMNFTR
jgi:Peptidase family M23